MILLGQRVALQEGAAQLDGFLNDVANGLQKDDDDHGILLSWDFEGEDVGSVSRPGVKVRRFDEGRE
jgi:hypothetical protein